MDKDMVHIYNDYYSAIKKNEIMLSVVRQMNLESVILSEVSHFEEKNRMPSFICGI